MQTACKYNTYITNFYAGVYEVFNCIFVVIFTDKLVGKNTQVGWVTRTIIMENKLLFI